MRYASDFSHKQNRNKIGKSTVRRADTWKSNMLTDEKATFTEKAMFTEKATLTETKKQIITNRFIWTEYFLRHKT